MCAGPPGLSSYLQMSQASLSPPGLRFSLGYNVSALRTNSYYRDIPSYFQSSVAVFNRPIVWPSQGLHYGLGIYRSLWSSGHIADCTVVEIFLTHKIWGQNLRSNPVLFFALILHPYLKAFPIITLPFTWTKELAVYLAIRSSQINHIRMIGKPTLFCWAF